MIKKEDAIKERKSRISIVLERRRIATELNKKEMFLRKTKKVKKHSNTVTIQKSDLTCQDNFKSKLE